MDSQKLEYYRKKLLDKKDRILSELNSVAVKDKSSSGYEAQYKNISEDEEDNIQEQANYERDILVEETLEETLESIDRALARIDAGTYGRDINTGEIIDERRLDILPEAEKTVV
ncbi:MAG: TraR/DksA family transcriptional regulator [Minisyncoccia bacterium]